LFHPGFWGLLQRGPAGAQNAARCELNIKPIPSNTDADADRFDECMA
jgi:hypothetical protein